MHCDICIRNIEDPEELLIKARRLNTREKKAAAVVSQLYSSTYALTVEFDAAVVLAGKTSLKFTYKLDFEELATKKVWIYYEDLEYDATIGLRVEGTFLERLRNVTDVFVGLIVPESLCADHLLWPVYNYLTEGRPSGIRAHLRFKEKETTP